MGLYVRPDSPYFWMLLEGRTDATGNALREKTKIRRDGNTPALRRDARELALVVYHERMLALSRDDHAQPAKKLATSFSAFVDWFSTHVLPHRRGKEREAEILPRLLAHFGDLPLTAIDRARVSEYATMRLTTPTVVQGKRRTKARRIQPGPSTVNREVDLLKCILQAAVPKYLASSPLFGMKRLDTKTPKRRLMTADEEARLLAVMAPADAALFLIALDSLVRLSDVLDVTWADDHGRSLWIADPKVGGGFEVPLSQRARQALDQLPRPKNLSQPIFASRRTAKTARDRRNGIRQMLERYCAAADPPIPFGRAHGGLSFHWATRRTGSTRMLTRGVDVGTVQKVGRWKTPMVVLGIYHELIDDKARAAVEAVGPPRCTPKGTGRRARKNRRKSL